MGGRQRDGGSLLPPYTLTYVRANSSPGKPGLTLPHPGATDRERQTPVMGGEVGRGPCWFSQAQEEPKVQLPESPRWRLGRGSMGLSHSLGLCGPIADMPTALHPHGPPGHHHGHTGVKGRPTCSSPSQSHQGLCDFKCKITQKKTTKIVAKLPVLIIETIPGRPFDLQLLC